MALPYSRALIVEDLEVVPDDGHRYELLDGSLIVTPAPHGHHQIAVTALWQVFEAVIPEDFRALVGPYEWQLASDTALQPDVAVVRRSDVGRRHLVPPLLVAEVLSPSTRAFDQLIKREAYDRGGVEAYWIVDPEVPSITVLGRSGAGLAVVASAEGDGELRVDVPFAVRVRPSDLLR